MARAQKLFYTMPCHCQGQGEPSLFQEERFFSGQVSAAEGAVG